MKGFLALIFTVLGVGAVVAPRPAAAANCTVLNSNDSGADSLRNCIDAVATNDGDVITIDSSVTTPIALTSGALNIEAGITITGAGPSVSVIDASGNGNNRIFIIDATINDKTINISGVTLQGATVSGGGAALFLADNLLNLSDCVFKDNTNNHGTLNGGAIEIDGTATMIVDNCQFTNNQVQAGSDGGAIASAGILSITNSTFTDNFTQVGLSGEGGAIFVDGGAAQIHNSTFSGNKSDSTGGAIHYDADGDLVVQNSTFDNNSSADGRGGALYQANGVLRLMDSDFTNNKSFLAASGAVQINDFAIIENCFFDNNTAADDDGGALHNDGNMILRNSTFTNNKVSEGDGGAIYVDDTALIENCTIAGNRTEGAGSDDEGGGISVNSDAFIQNTTIFDNQAQHFGGGLYINSTTTLNNVTIAGNTALADGGGIFNNSTLTFTNSILAGNTDDGGEPDCFNNSTMNSAGPNLIQDPTGCALSSGTALGGDPGLADALADNGGPGIGVDGAHPTLTLALEAGGAALEAGDNGTCAATDERGTVRPQGPVCDLGAFEIGPSADLSATSLIFDQQEVGTTSGAQTVTLTNNGPIALTINSIAIGGDNAGDFDQTNNCGTTVAPGASCNIDATFSPEDTGVRTAQITVDTSANLQSISLLGAGITGGGGGGCSLGGDADAKLPSVAMLVPFLGLGAMWLIRKRA